MNPYRCVFHMGIEKSLEYRVNFLLTMTSSIFPVIIQTIMWTYFYGKTDAAASTGYTYSQIMIYTLLATLVSQLVSTGFAWQMNDDIKRGGLNKYLVRPVHYGGYQLSSFLGEKIPQLLMLLVVSVAVISFSAAVFGLTLSATRILLFIISLLFALALNFFLFYTVALTSFWLTDVDQFFGTISIVLVVISGGVLPLDIFGEKTVLITKILPFGYTTQFPVNIINGRYDMQAVGVGFLCQLFWVAFFGILGEVLWKKGLQRYVAVSG
ncbi:MAG: ABC-2 family transporter protein [Lachnospiraceae bacterium]|nr:ABC-2 family transporter protein [Lachnospiraceae bacterium]